MFSITAGEYVAPTCCEELLRLLPHIPEYSWDERFSLGGVYVNGREAHRDTSLSAPCTIEYFEPLVPLEKVGESYPGFSSEFVQFHDDDVGVVFKPAGLPTTAPRDQTRYNLQVYLSEYFGKPVHLPSRLDVGVAGLVLFSLSARMNRILQRAFSARTVRKSYVAEVRGDYPGGITDLKGSLARDPRHPVLRQVVETGGEEAHTHVRRLCTYTRDGESRSLLYIEPRTGRTHQIRVHVAAAGYPIVGDPYYGGSDALELRLISYGVSFHHPYQARRLSFELPLAQRPIWFQNVEEVSDFVSSRMRGEVDESNHGR